MTHDEKPEPPKPREFFVLAGYSYTDRNAALRAAEMYGRFGEVIHVREVLPEAQ